ncbi:MAG: NfeD family protein [Dehalococcoidales bacterium]|nr:NfeD family protein [Dehalococcoidales bacterium]
MGTEVNVLFVDAWLWLIFIGVGLILIITELLLGVETGLDLVFIGSALILGGLITMAFDSWVWTALASGVIGLAYIIIGRRYIHRRMAVDAVKTNIDTIIGKTGIVREPISAGSDGLVKVQNEHWKARADERINEGEFITVTAVNGVTLSVVKKEDGGNS